MHGHSNVKATSKRISHQQEHDTVIYSYVVDTMYLIIVEGKGFIMEVDKLGLVKRKN